MTLFLEKCQFSRRKFLTTFFLVIDQILRFFTLLNVVLFVYNLFFTRKTAISENNSLITPFFNSVRTFARIPTTLLLKILGRPMHGPSPPSQILGGQAALGRRRWL